MLAVCLVMSSMLVALVPTPFVQDAAAPQRRELGFGAGKAGDEPTEGWRARGEGWRAELTAGRTADGPLAVKLFLPQASDAPFGNVMRSLDATAYRGRSVRLSARVRAEGAAGGQAQMWLRVDRENGQTGGFDNMDDRPIEIARAPDRWTDAMIAMDIDADAEALVFGVLSIGGATVFVDAVALEVSGPAQPTQAASPPAPLTPRALANLAAATRLLGYVRFFHPSDEVVGVQAWGHAAIDVLTAAEPAADAADLAARLQRVIAPLAPTLIVWAGGEEGAPALPAVPAGASVRRHWRHVGAGVGGRKASNIYRSEVRRVALGSEAESGHAASYVAKGLGGGVTCRLPVHVYADQEHTLPHRAESSLADRWSSVAALPKLTALNRSTRLASVALCWGVMQHFYPYFDVVTSDWDAALDSALRRAAEDIDEKAFLFTLRTLIAKLHDGHGNVYKADLRARSILPLTLAWAGEDVVVTGKATSMEDVKVGDVVLSLDGKSLADCYADIGSRISAATEGWRREVALRSLSTYFEGKQSLAARLRRPDGTQYDTTIDCSLEASAGVVDATANKSAHGAELAPGIVYFNLDGADAATLTKHMPTLAAAKGIVFDLRGYPGAAGYDLMPHLIDGPATSAGWNVPLVTQPDRAGWTWHKSSWNLQPIEPRLRGHIVFLTGHGAISYAESIMGIVEHYKMGEIVGATTAGTNGNINPFELPGGYTVVWTGMKVLKHDGTRHHGVGIAPTVPVEPTAKGIAEGRDEVLERGVEVLRAKIAASEKVK